MQLHRDFSLKVKALDDQEGTFIGYASTYGGPPDLVGDIIEPGAFKRAIDNQNAGYPLLWAHLPSEPLGLAKISDSATGLIVHGTLVMTDPAAQRAQAHLRAGSIKGLSIGYSIPQERASINAATGVRSIREIKLYEVSLVAIPANRLAVVTSVKSLGDIETMLRNVKPSDVDDGVLVTLRSIDVALKSLLPENGADEARALQLAADAAGLKDFALNLALELKRIA
jgi:HK97 family phage prohead protease